MKVALIGGTGYVGSYIIDELIKNDHIPRQGMDQSQR